MNYSGTEKKWLVQAATMACRPYVSLSVASSFINAGGGDYDREV
jgi:hypothetical protein